jgi:ferredoxin-NADP reductase
VPSDIGRSTGPSSLPCSLPDVDQAFASSFQNHVEPTDGHPLAVALPGQFIVLRLGSTSAPVLMRSYSLSGRPNALSLNTQALRRLDLPLGGDFYICGPASFMNDLTAGLAALGVAPDRIHTALFGAGPSVTPGIAASPRQPPHLPQVSAASGPMISFARSGLNVRWGSSFKTLLELAEACDVPVRWSCRGASATARLGSWPEQ